MTSEPGRMDTYHGHVRTPADAIKLFEACRLGLLPRVQRRLSEKERQSIRSGSVFVWDEREAGMRRWTDGKSWSASRVSGSFLTYREMEGKRGGGQFSNAPARRAGKTPDSGRGSDEDQEMEGDGPDGYRYKQDGLMKQSFSITTSAGQHLHLISYYSRPHPNSPELPQPTTDPQLRHIIPVKGMYPESTIHESPGPAVTRAPMQTSPYLSQQQHPSPQIQGSPGQGQRGHHAPYGYSMGYNWPPSPVATPPYPGHYAPSQYSPSLPPPAPQSSAYPGQPGSEHNSPYQSHQQPPHQRPLPTSAAHGSPRQPPYDRPLPPLADSTLPPPQPRGAHPNTMPAYQPGTSPRVEDPRAMAEQQRIAQQQAIAQRALQSTPMMDPRAALPPTSLPPVNGLRRTTTPPQHHGNSQSSTPQSSGRPVSPNDPPKPPSQAQSIPSISHLVHATDSVSVISDNKSNSSRPGSRSPRENGDQQPKDIPHEKLNTRVEDQRAIRVLDQKFAF